MQAHQSGWMEQLSTIEQQAGWRGNALTHFVGTIWMVLTAMLSVIVGFATLNMVLADSGFAVLNEHSPMLMALVARVTRQA